MRFCTVGSANTCLTAALSLATTSFGVFFGAHRPCQNGSTMSAETVSAMVGTSGSGPQRFSDSVTNAFILPARTCSSVCDASAQNRSIWLPTRSCITGAPPLYGTNVPLTPTLSLK